jgi:hypothetical protein
MAKHSTHAAPQKHPQHINVPALKPLLRDVVQLTGTAGRLTLRAYQREVARRW